MKVCMIVPNAMVKGGIAAVVNGYRGSQLEKDYDITYVESYCDGTKITKLMKGIKGYFQFLKVLLTVNPDIIHIHSSFGPSFYRKIPFIMMADWFHKPIINHIHGAEFDSFFTNASDRKKKLIRKVYLKCSKLIALSEEWRVCLRQIVPESRIVVIENYSKGYPDALEQRLARESNNTILFLGELGKRKGCYDIPDVVQKVAAKVPNVQFVLAGDGAEEDKKAIKQLIKEKNVEKNVQFPGWVRGDEKDYLLREADIFFLPTYNEGMPMSILDAMGYGMPIVSTNVGGIPKIVQDGRNGFCRKPGNVSAMAEDLVNLLTMSTFRNTCCMESLTIVKEKYSFENHIKRIGDLYNTMEICS